MDGGSDGKLLPLIKIQKQQKDLEKLRDVVERQQATIGRLSVHAGKRQAERDKAERETKRPVEERLRFAEKRAGDLGQRLEASEGLSAQTYELRCLLQSLQEKVQQRDQAIEKMITVQTRQDEAASLLQESLGLAQEDLLGAWGRAESTKILQLGGAKTAEVGPTDDAPTPGLSSNNPSIGCDSNATVVVFPTGTAPAQHDDEEESHLTMAIADVEERHMVGVQVSHSDFESCLDPGWESDEDSSPAAGTASLRAELDRLRSEKTEIRKRSAQEVQELRALVREQQRCREVERFDNSSNPNEGSPFKTLPTSSPGNEEDEGFEEDELPEETSNSTGPLSSGLLYVQKIDELVQLNAGLERDQKLLEESEHCLLEDSREKDRLIAYLMRQLRPSDVDPGTLDPGGGGSAKPPSSQTARRQLGGGAGAGGGDASSGVLDALGLGGLAKVSGWPGGLGGLALGGLGLTATTEPDVTNLYAAELERVAEEAMRDNVRLRHDLGVLAEEFRKAIAVRVPKAEKA